MSQKIALIRWTCGEDRLPCCRLSCLAALMLTILLPDTWQRSDSEVDFSVY